MKVLWNEWKSKRESHKLWWAYLMISLKVWSRWLAFRICSDWEVSRSLLWRHQMSQRKAWSLLTNQRSTKKCFSIVLDSRNTKLNNISFHFYNNLKWLSHFLAFSSNSNLKHRIIFNVPRKESAYKGAWLHFCR